MNRPRFAPAIGCVAFGLIVACAPPSQEATPARPETEATAGQEEQTGPPAPPPRGDVTRSPGYLSWEDLTVRMVGQSGPNAGLRIDVTTIHDEALRLAGDDVRAYFRDLKGKIPDAVPGEEWRKLKPFLVGFTGFEKEISFDPTRLVLRSEGSTLYPRYIVPVSSGFDRQLVGLHETLYGIYLFPSEIDLFATLEFRYRDLSSGTRWRNVVEQIERAKTRRTSEGEERES